MEKSAAVSFLWNGTRYCFRDGRYWKRVFVYGEGYREEDCTLRELGRPLT